MYDFEREKLRKAASTIGFTQSKSDNRKQLGSVDIIHKGKNITQVGHKTVYGYKDALIAINKTKK